MRSSMSRSVAGTAAVVAVSTLLLAGCSTAPQATASATAAAPVTVLDTPRLETADNFRDVAGTGTALATSDGDELEPGVVYRSNALSLSEDDQKTLDELGVTTVIDLRTDAEAEEAPDVLPDGVEYVHVDLIGATQNGAVTQTGVPSADEAGELLEDVNVQLATDAAVLAPLKTAFEAIAEAEGPVVIHCTAGKDRTGWVSAILQANAGVSAADVMENYLLTNVYIQTRVDATVAQISESQGEDVGEAYRVLLGVDASYLQAGLDALESAYGSVQDYLADGVGLDEDTIAELRDLLRA